MNAGSTRFLQRLLARQLESARYWEKLPTAYRHVSPYVRDIAFVYHHFKHFVAVPYKIKWHFQFYVALFFQRFFSVQKHSIKRSVNWDKLRGFEVTDDAIESALFRALGSCRPFLVFLPCVSAGNVRKQGRIIHRLRSCSNASFVSSDRRVPDEILFYCNAAESVCIANGPMFISVLSMHELHSGCMSLCLRKAGDFSACRLLQAPIGLARTYRIKWASEWAIPSDVSKNSKYWQWVHRQQAAHGHRRTFCTDLS